MDDGLLSCMKSFFAFPYGCFVMRRLLGVYDAEMIFFFFFVLIFCCYVQNIVIVCCFMRCYCDLFRSFFLRDGCLIMIS